MGANRRGTNRPVARPDLSRHVREYYRGYFTNVGRGREREEFERVVAAVWEDLQDAKSYEADPAFLLHVLVCLKFRRAIPGPARSAAVRRLTWHQRRALAGGLRVLLQLGEPWLTEVLGSAQQDWARTLYVGASLLDQTLRREVTIETPAFQLWSGAVPTRRQAERLLTAGIVCLMGELKSHPKPAAATVVLLEKFGLLPRRRGGVTAVEFVKKRARRAKGKESDPFDPVGSPVEQLRGSYGWLKESLPGTRGYPRGSSGPAR